MALILAMAASTAVCQQGIIVESFEDGANPDGFQKVDGNWMPSVSKSKAEGLKATKSQFHTADGKPGAVKFVPPIPAAGKFDVYATYPQSGNAQAVIYKVHSADGDKEMPFDQNGWDPAAQPPANAWFLVGTFQFAQGSEGYVEIRDPGTGKPASEKAANPRVYADAVMLLPAGSPPPGGVSAAAPAPTAPVAGLQPLTAPAAPAAPPAAAPALPAGLPALGAASPASIAAPSIPSLGAAMPSSPSAPAGAPNALPSLPIDAAPAALPSGMPSLPGTAPAVGAAPLPPLPPSGISPPSMPPLPSLTPAAAAKPPAPAPTPDAVPAAPFQADSSLQWLFDMGAAQSAAKAEKKRIFVFFVAPGNRIASRYESQYFTAPSVRPLLDKYVLVKIDFPKNTKQGYALGVFGAGNIVVTDHFGTKIGAVGQVPATPEELAKALEAIK